MQIARSLLPPHARCVALVVRYFAAVGIHVDDFGALCPLSLLPEPTLSDDAVLTALTQLGSLRLQCDRAFVSLIGQQWQYIIAESSPELPYRREQLKPSHRMCMGFTAIASEMAICLNTLKCFTDPNMAVDDANTHANTTRYHIRDLRQDPVFRDRPYVTAWPNFRAYLEVPLRTSTGLVIGSYCVIDSRLRPDLDDSAVAVMSDIACTIMDHLDLLKKKQQCERAERLVRGLGVFIEDCSTQQTSPLNDTSPLAVPSSDGLSTQPQSSPSSSGSSEAFVVTSSSEGTETTNSPGLTTPLSFFPDIDPMDPTAEYSQSPQDVISARPRHRPRTARESPLDNKAIFARAADLIHESTCVEGIVFLDVRQTGFSELHSAPDSSYRNSSDETAVPLVKDFDTGVMCDVLASSTGSHAASAKQDFNMPEALLRRLMHSTPHGCLMYADKHGPMPTCTSRNAEHSGCDTRASEAKQQAAQDDIEQLFSIVPQARSILYLPLWDYHKATWHATMISWTTDPARSFEEGDMTYMAAFSNSIMTEVARQDALLNSAAKGDFISSISHEFRSPLHGIMASTELLEDTVAHDPDQRQLTAMIKSCATTLLDTTNHLLDYAKINTLAKDGRPQVNRASLSAGPSSITTLSSTVDLAQLVEDVVEGAFIGHAAQMKPQAHNGCLTDPPLRVTVDFEQRDSWALRTEPGAWRRIVMNVFGNALKYTPHGSIEVSLRTAKTTRLSSAAPDAAPYNSTDICLAVTDTGCGMSADYLKRQIFLPYSQENPLSSGVGLGLSIVQHLVTELGGRVDVESTLGVGTRVLVTVPTGDGTSIGPLQQSASPDADERREAFAALRGKTVLALDFDAPPAPAHQSLLPAFSVLAKSWLDVNVLALEDHNGEEDDYIGDNSHVEGLLLHGRSTGATAAAAMSEDTAPAPLPLIVLTKSMPTALQKERARSRNATFLVQPFGPRKLAWTVRRAFARHNAAHQGGSAFADVPPELPAPVHAEEELKEELREKVKMEVTEETKELRKEIKELREEIRKEEKGEKAKHTDLSPSSSSLPAAAAAKAKPSERLSSPPLYSSMMATKRSSPQTTKTPRTKTTSPPPSTRRLPSSPPHVLVVDDNSINLKILTTYLKKLKCTYETATNGLEAVEAFRRRSKKIVADGTGAAQFDYILMDMSMPIMDGFKATRIIRADECAYGVVQQGARTGSTADSSSNGKFSTPSEDSATTAAMKKTIIVAVTGLGADSSQKEAFASGVDMYLMKPVLLKKLKELLVPDGGG